MGANIPKELSMRIFRVFDVHQRGYITRDEFLCGMTVLTRGTQDERIKCKFPARHNNWARFCASEFVLVSSTAKSTAQKSCVVKKPCCWWFACIVPALTEKTPMLFKQVPSNDVASDYLLVETDF